MSKYRQIDPLGRFVTVFVLTLVVGGNIAVLCLSLINDDWDYMKDAGLGSLLMLCVLGGAMCFWSGIYVLKHRRTREERLEGYIWLLFFVIALLLVVIIEHHY